MMFEQDSHKSLDAAQHSLMNHNRTHLCARRLHNFGIESFGQYEIKLYRPALPFAAILILQDEFKLGAIERPFARLQAKFKARRSRGRCKRRFCLVPRASEPSRASGLVENPTTNSRNPNRA